MKIKANYHTHHKMCGHAKGNTYDYVKMAKEANLEVIGMSDHLYIPKSFMSESYYKSFWLDEQMDEKGFFEYIDEVNDAKLKNPDIKILLGAETEYISGKLDYYTWAKKHLDYLLVGIHYFEYKNKFYSTYDPMDKELLIAYTDVLVEAINTNFFTIAVHPDLFMYNYTGDNGHLEFDKTCEECSKRIIEAAIKNNVYLEINCGCFNKSKKTPNNKEYLYPRSEFWKIASKYDCKVVIGVDAHKPEELIEEGVKIALNFAKENNIKLVNKIDCFK